MTGADAMLASGAAVVNPPWRASGRAPVAHADTVLLPPAQAHRSHQEGPLG